MIYIRTIAYNASGTLERAVESILDQTYGDFTYYLIENGSTDNGKTKGIVEKYAAKDPRIKAFYNIGNFVWENNEEALYLPHNIKDDDLFCVLDADDAYDINFLEEMLSFMNENDLDIAACGSDFINAQTDKVESKRCFEVDMIVSEDGFNTLYPYYHVFSRTVWGKLYKGKTLVNTILDPLSEKTPKGYGGDTFFTTYALKEAKRFGILSKVLHKYYISSKSSSYVSYKETRMLSDRILYEQAQDFLSPYGPLLPRNENFMFMVFLYAIRDTFNVLLTSNLSAMCVVENMLKILDYDAIHKMKRCNYQESQKLFSTFRSNVAEWILSQKQVLNSKKYAEPAAEVFFLLFNFPFESLNEECMALLIMKATKAVSALLEGDYGKALQIIQERFKTSKNKVPLISELEQEISDYLR